MNTGKILLFLLLFLSVKTFSQVISLQQCIDSALVNYPLSSQAKVYAQIEAGELQNIKTGNLPQVDLTAKASWQSEVMSLPIQLPGIEIPELNKDQYKIQLEISQSIYKGGLTGAQQQLAATETEISNAQNNLELMKLKNTIISLYFQILLADKASEVLISQRDILEKKQTEIQAIIGQGMALSTNADALLAEILTLDQRLIDLNYNRKSLTERLSKYTGIGLESLISLEIPETEINFNQTQNRPEFQYLEFNRTKIEVLKTMQRASSRPMAYAFSTLGYGRPGFNYLNNDFAPYALVGVGMSWKIWDWNKSKQNIQLLDLKSQSLLNQQNTFELNLNSELTTLLSEISKQERLLTNAKELVPLRERLMKTAEVQFQQGVIRSSEYIDEIKKHEKAVLEMKTVEVKLAIAKLNYLMALGKI